MREELLRVCNLAFRYNQDKILSDISFSVFNGEFISVVGTNGVGKTILGKVLSGGLPYHSGIVVYEGEMQESSGEENYFGKIGIGYIPEMGMILENLTVAENLFIGQEKGHGCYLSKRRIYALAKSLIQKYHFAFTARSKGYELSEPQKRIVMLIRQLIGRPKLLIIDGLMDYVSNMDNWGVEQLLNDLSKQGTTIIYLTYNFSIAALYSDRILIMNAGQIVYELERNEFTEQKLYQVSTGVLNHLHNIANKSQNESKEQILKVDNLSSSRLKKISFSLCKGEIIGIVGITSGIVTEFLECISGHRNIDSGDIYIQGNKVKIKDPKTAIVNGIRICGDNYSKSLLDFSTSIRMNLSMGVLKRIQNKGLISSKYEQILVREYCQRFGITVDIDRRLDTLNYATLARVAIAACMINNPQILILNKVTRGLDETGMAGLYDVLLEVRKTCGVIVNFSKVEKEIDICDRVVFMKEDNINTELKQGEINYKSILYAIDDMNGQKGR